MEATGQVDATGDIAPLIRAADLQPATVSVIQLGKIEGLQNHVAEFCKADACAFAVEPLPNGFFADHIVDRKVLADVAQKVEHIDVCHPIEVIDHQRRIVPCKVDKLADLLADPGDPIRHHLRGVQLPLGGLETRITDQASGTPHQRDGSMPGGLKATQHQ